MASTGTRNPLHFFAFLLRGSTRVDFLDAELRDISHVPHKYAPHHRCISLFITVHFEGYFTVIVHQVYRGLREAGRHQRDARRHSARTDVMNSTGREVSSKVLEIQVLYEQDSPLLDARLDAAKIFIFREKKIPAEKKLLLNNFLDMLKQILNPKTLGNRKRIEKLKEKIQALNGVAEHDWLTEKLNKLLPKAK